VDGPVREGPFAFVHHPVRMTDAYTIAGHLHPGAVLRGAARQRERLPCFWFGTETAVLPAFGEFTGLADVRPAEGDRVWVIAEGSVIAARTPAAPVGYWA
jgi:metallophosphoesterase superfamily enzyme